MRLRVGGPHPLSLSFSLSLSLLWTYHSVYTYPILCIRVPYYNTCEENYIRMFVSVRPTARRLAGRTIPPPRENCIHPREAASATPRQSRWNPFGDSADLSSSTSTLTSALLSWREPPRLAFHHADNDYFELAHSLWILLLRVVVK